MTHTAHADLIILAAPKKGDAYYHDRAQSIIDFQIAFAQAIQKPDYVIILSGQGYYDTYQKALGSDAVRLVQMPDIWMRDFTITNPEKPIMFRYTAAGQGNHQGEADYVQDIFKQWIDGQMVDYHDTSLRNDGGNFVSDRSHAIISRKFLNDNKISEKNAMQKLRQLTGKDMIAFIDADEQGGLEHADGVVSFIDEGVLMINDYPDDPDYAASLYDDLTKRLPGITIHRIDTPYDDSDIYDSRFGSACGLYTNALVTHTHVYLPQFGTETDKVVLEKVRQWTSKTVVPVSSQGVCAMGGGVRCLSLQLQLQGDQMNTWLNHNG